MVSKSNKPKKADTKSSSYPGKSYFENAAKQFEWPINFEDKTILVPESELSKAEDNLMVAHFRSHGWHIQSCIDVIKTKPFIAPVLNGSMFKPLKPMEEKEQLFKLNDKFKILSTECLVQIFHMEKGKIHMRYLNRNKPNLLSSEENLSAMLRRKLWEKVL